MEAQAQSQPPVDGGGGDGLVALTSRMQYFEQELVRSISAIVKNVSEYFQLANGTSSSSSIPATLNSSFWSTLPFRNENNTSTSTAIPASENVSMPPMPASIFGITWDDVFTQLLLLVSLTFFLWIVNRRFLRWSTLATVTEVVLSWVAMIAISPLVILVFGPIILARIAVATYLRLRTSGRRVFLANPFEAVWTFEAPNSPSTCVGFYIVEGDGNLERIRSDLHRRVILRQVDGVYVNDVFRHILRRVAGFIVWERAEHFDITNHIRYATDRTSSAVRNDPTRPWTEQDVFDELEAIHETSLCDLHQLIGLPEPIPPWEILIVPQLVYRDGDPAKLYYGVVIRVHHSMMDGVSMGNLLHDCISDRPFKFSVDPIAPLRIPLITRVIGHVLSIVALPRTTFGNLFFFEKNAFHGRSLTGPKKFGWCRPLRMETLKVVKNVTKSSVFAVLLSCIGGSLQRLYAKRAPGKVPRIVHACPPVAILPYPNRYPRNRFSIVLYPVALRAAKTALDRLAQVYRESRSLATSPDVLSNYYVVYILGLLPYPVLKVLAPLAHATFTLSNIPGPAEPIKIFGGDQLVEVGAWIPIKNRIGIGTALFSYQDRLRVTFIADKAALAEPDDVALLRDGFEDEVSDLVTSLQLKCDTLFIE